MPPIGAFVVIAVLIIFGVLYAAALETERNEKGHKDHP